MTTAEREETMSLVKEAAQAGARRQPACKLLGITLRTLERWEREQGAYDKRLQTGRRPGNALTMEERQAFLDKANSVPYRDLPPCKIIPQLADEGEYLGSESTLYRLLRAENQLVHRQATRVAAHTKPKAYTASGGNQVWTWDISYLPTQIQGLYIYLYLIIDIYSRKIVGWQVHENESSGYAARLIKQACLDENVQQEQLVLHSDNGSPMKGMTMLAMLETLGVIPSFSRPSVSDDNPYSEALFRTLKYHPNFPMREKFAALADARAWCERFVSWYNTQHLHSALKFVTPAQRHTGEDKAIRQQRHAVYTAARIRHPERWTGATRDWSLPLAVTLNPNKKLSQDKQTNSDSFLIVA